MNNFLIAWKKIVYALFNNKYSDLQKFSDSFYYFFMTE